MKFGWKPVDQAVQLSRQQFLGLLVSGPRPRAGQSAKLRAERSEAGVGNASSAPQALEFCQERASLDGHRTSLPTQATAYLTPIRVS